MDLFLALVLTLAPAQTSEEPPPPGAEEIKEESKCTKILRKFKGMDLVAAELDPIAERAVLIYRRVLSKRHHVLFRIDVKTCSGIYELTDARNVDPSPRECPEGATCL